MEFEFLRKLDVLRHTVGFPIPINSGFRCPDYNDQVSQSGRSGPHTTGRAADLALSFTGARKALTTISELFPGVGLNQKGESRFVHVDTLKPRIWTY